MLYEDNEGLVRLQVDIDDNGGDDVNFDNDDGAQGLRMQSRAAQ